MNTRVLLDECLPKKLKYRIEELSTDFSVHTVPEINWNSYPDGKLMVKAEKEFDVFITTDRNLSFQNPVHKMELHILLLIAPTNTYEDLLPLVKQMAPIISNHKPRSLSQIQLDKK